MPLPQLKVLDISHHNPIEPGGFRKMYDYGIRGIIHKSSQGSGMKDQTYDARRKGALDAGLLWGAYHFADNTNVDHQIDNFLTSAKPNEHTLLALDYEPYAANTMSLKQAREFLEKLDAKMTRKTVLYSGNLIKETLKSDKDGFFGSHPLWLAQYGQVMHLPFAWKKAFLWQFSGDGINTQGYKPPGISGQIDMNSFDGTDVELAEQWVIRTGFEAKPQPAPKNEQVASVEAPEGGSKPWYRRWF